MPISHEDAAALHARGDWTALWEASIPLVKHAITKLLRAGQLTADRVSDDLLQEGYLAARRALPKWDPEAGKLSTWIAYEVRGAMLDHLRRERSIVGGRRSTRLSVLIQDDITPDDRDPDAEAKEVQHARDLINLSVALAQLTEEERNLVERIYGIGRPSESMADICRDLGMSRPTGWRRLQAVQIKMRRLVKSGDTCVSLDKGAHSDRTNKSPLRRHQGGTR
ncbi:MAG TPA: sigma-70 family RNA polymerase sigma factor [Steroidobacteraceae bacterium]|nr:sigma-70 family RNA polymerase sigma factor [Steroidobacteraceae bacterium]